ncbi:MAG: hypothetical protein R3C12_22395 [Planctomycetaceae bacterium]
MISTPLTREPICAGGSDSVDDAASAGDRGTMAEAKPEFQLNYMLASCMYGYLPLAEIVPEVTKIEATGDRHLAEGRQRSARATRSHGRGEISSITGRTRGETWVVSRNTSWVVRITG